MTAGGARTVVAMAAAHLPAVAALCGELGYTDEAISVASRFPAIHRDPDHGLFVAVDDAGAVIGFIHVLARRTLHVEAAAQVVAMAVAKTHRRRGIGTLLLARAEAWAADQGLAAVMLYSRDGRDDAHGFYATAGYRPAVGLSRYDKPLASAGKRRKA
ncbi:MAG: GNAT family N-acetyltransferase [Rhodospirillales bacterium]|nr:GNAT family N-acetyltransferase [Rhodospirillales bacterium]MBI2585703.1 GNAT family N-acetyltransferase [Rhodospirillales bacterium]